MTKLRDLLAKIIIIVAILGGLSQFAEAGHGTVHYLKINLRLKIVSGFCLKAPGHFKSPTKFAKVWSRLTRSRYWGKVNPNAWSKGNKAGLASSSKRSCLAAIEVLKTKGYRVGR